MTSDAAVVTRFIVLVLVVCCHLLYYFPATSEGIFLLKLMFSMIFEVIRALVQLIPRKQVWLW